MPSPSISGSFTMTVTSSLVVNSPSNAVNCNTYVPALGKVAVVSTAPTSAKTTVPGPLTWLQLVLTAPGGSGSPSSITVASRKTLSSGKVIDWSAPSSTIGAWLPGMLGESVINPSLGTAS